MGRHKKPQSLTLQNVLPTRAAAHRLGVTPQNMARLVDEGTLTAYIFDKETGAFTPKPQEEKRRGQTYFFIITDLDSWKARRHAGREEVEAVTPRQAYQKRYYQTHTRPKRLATKTDKKAPAHEF